jgi:hypothetical protein
VLPVGCGNTQDLLRADPGAPGSSYNNFQPERALTFDEQKENIEDGNEDLAE